MLIVAVMIAIWVACGAATAGITYAYFDSEFPTLRGTTKHRELLGLATYFALFGPIGLLVAFLSSGFARHGWRLWPARC